MIFGAECTTYLITTVGQVHLPLGFFFSFIFGPNLFYFIILFILFSYFSFSILEIRRVDKLPLSFVSNNSGTEYIEMLLLHFREHLLSLCGRCWGRDVRQTNLLENRAVKIGVQQEGQGYRMYRGCCRAPKMGTMSFQIYSRHFPPRKRIQTGYPEICLFEILIVLS